MMKKGEKNIGLETRLKEGLAEAGCDEAGRGPLAGPVFAAAVILPPDFRHPGLNDSKKLSRAAREELREVIMENAVAYAVEAVSAAEIDEINILNASIAGMWRAVMSLPVKPEFIAVDGNRFRPYGSIPGIRQSYAMSRSEADRLRLFGPMPQRTSTPQRTSMLQQMPSGADSAAGPDEWPFLQYADIPFECAVKGDGRYADIAAASVLAKTERDRHMLRLAEEYPQYGWDRNMGYPTKDHIEAIRRYGYTPHHRKSFHVRELEPALF